MAGETRNSTGTMRRWTTTLKPKNSQCKTEQMNIKVKHKMRSPRCHLLKVSRQNLKAEKRKGSVIQERLPGSSVLSTNSPTPIFEIGAVLG